MEELLKIVIVVLGGIFFSLIVIGAAVYEMMVNIHITNQRIKERLFSRDYMSQVQGESVLTLLHDIRRVTEAQERTINFRLPQISKQLMEIKYQPNETTSFKKDA